MAVSPSKSSHCGLLYFFLLSSETEAPRNGCRSVVHLSLIFGFLTHLLFCILLSYCSEIWLNHWIWTVRSLLIGFSEQKEEHDWLSEQFSLCWLVSVNREKNVIGLANSSPVVILNMNRMRTCSLLVLTQVHSEALLSHTNLHNFKAVLPLRGLRLPSGSHTCDLFVGSCFI